VDLVPLDAAAREKRLAVDGGVAVPCLAALDHDRPPSPEAFLRFYTEPDMRRRRLGLALLPVIVAACGGTPASIAPSPSPIASIESSSTASASTRLVADVDVGGRTMHLVCVGPIDTGEPTILLEAGGGGDVGSWDQIMPAMQSTHRLCAYDRLGLGASDPPAEASRTTADQVADLRALVDVAGVSGPFVIGSHSYGAHVAILFTQAVPDDVAGLLFIEPESPRFSASVREALPPATAGEPASVAELRDVVEGFETDPSRNPEHILIRTSHEEAAAALDAPGPLFGDRPVVVLSAGITPGRASGLPSDLATTVDGLWAAAQQELADESTAGSRETVPGAGHGIQFDRPQAVIDALEWLLDDLTSP
jgi:pimeloyl-ACP methyl ester carboxylesterase